MTTISNTAYPAHKQLHFLTGSLLLIWLCAIVLMAFNKVFVTEPGEPPLAILISFATTFISFTVAYLSLPWFRRYVLNIDMRFLIMIHSWRMLGMGFIMLYLFDQLPALFAYLAGLGDALTAIMAVFLSYALFNTSKGVSRKWILQWNIFGLVDFIVAVSIGILTRTDAILAPANGVNSDLMTSFPFVMIPGFLVQVFALTHIIIFLQLRNNHKLKENINLGKTMP